MIVRERKEVVDYLISHGLTKQFLQVKQFLQDDLFNIVS